MDKYTFERNYKDLVLKFENDLKKLYLNYIHSRYGFTIHDFIKVCDKDLVSYFYVEDIIFRGPNFSIQGRTHSSPFFELKLTPVDRFGNILWISSGARFYEDYANVEKIDMCFSGKKIDCLGNILPI